jgi:hypothetical protein
MPHLRAVSEQVLRTADSQHGGLSVWTKTLGQKMVVKYGFFSQSPAPLKINDLTRTKTPDKTTHVLGGFCP